MDPTGQFTTLQLIKIIEAYFATKSVFLTQQQYRKDFGRNNVSDRKTIQGLVAKFWETGSVADAPQNRKCSRCPTMATVVDIVQIIQIHQMLNCPSIRYIAPAKIFSALPLCQKN